MLFLSKKEFISKQENLLKEDEVLKVKNLNVSFKTKSGILRAVRGIDLTVKKSQIVGLVGESGSGKSVCVKTIIGFNDGSLTTADNLNLMNIDLTKIKKNKWIFIRGTKVAYIPQDPLMSLNPTKTISSQLLEAIKVSEYREYQWKLFDLKSSNVTNKEEYIKIKQEYKSKTKKSVMYNRMIDLLNFIGIVNPKDKVKCYPHEFSGGMRQRIAIAMAVAVKPDLIIADEPTTALDVTIQAKVLDLIKKLRDEMNVSIIFISHNIALVANFCDYIYVIYAGKVIEKGTRKDIFTNPLHPYSWALISSIPDPNSEEELISISGTPPNMLSPPRGDSFAPRNQYAMKIDFELEPPLFQISETHFAATWLLSPDAPKIEIPKDIREKAIIALSSINKIKQKGKESNEQ